MGMHKLYRQKRKEKLERLVLIYEREIEAIKDEERRERTHLVSVKSPRNHRRVCSIDVPRRTTQPQKESD